MVYIYIYTYILYKYVRNMQASELRYVSYNIYFIMVAKVYLLIWLQISKIYIAKFLSL